jgi:hypothetical protein
MADSRQTLSRQPVSIGRDSTIPVSSRKAGNITANAAGNVSHSPISNCYTVGLYSKKKLKRRRRGPWAAPFVFWAATGGLASGENGSMQAFQHFLRSVASGWNCVSCPKPWSTGLEYRSPGAIPRLRCRNRIGIAGFESAGDVNGLPNRVRIPLPVQT